MTKDMSAMFASLRGPSEQARDRLQSAFSGSEASNGATDVGPSANGHGLRDDDADLAGSWLDREGQGAVRDSAIPLNGAPCGAAPARPRSGRIVLQDSYWRYLEHVTASDAEPLSPAEVLEFLLHFGGSAQKARALAAELLDRFGSLGAVVTAEPTKIMEVVRGDDLSVMLLKAVRAASKAILREPLEDRPIIGSASALMDYLSVTMRHEPTEATRILFLDRKNALIRDEIQQRGTVDHTPLYPREVVRRVIELGASAIILVHNHPSGDPTPSQSDIEMTRRLAAALNTISVVLHDHVIVGRNKEISLRKEALI
jgi:DNA repair protein RadC